MAKFSAGAWEEGRHRAPAAPAPLWSGAFQTLTATGLPWGVTCEGSPKKSGLLCGKKKF